MKWEAIHLGDVIDVKHGYPFDSKYYSDSGSYILLTPGNCHESGVPRPQFFWTRNWGK